MNFIVSKLNRDFTLHLVACDEDEQKFLESHIGEIVELSSRPTPRALDLPSAAVCECGSLYGVHEEFCPKHKSANQ
jgi:hypothetical protein